MTEMGSWYEAAIAPRTVAVVGASTNPAKNHYLDQLLTYGYKGGLYPIHPHADEISGLKAYRAIGDVPERIDLALVALPAAAVPQVLQECVAADVRVVYVMAAGFTEAGEEGREVARKAEVALAASGGRTRMLGPNGTGIIGLGVNLVALPLGARHVRLTSLRDDGIAIVSQSGLVASAGFIASQRAVLGVAKTFAVGNELDIRLPEILDAMAADDSVRVVLVYLEGLKDQKAFVAAAVEIRAAGKHLVVLKGVVTARGAAAAASHTASVSGQARVFSGVLRQVGAVEARSMAHARDVARIFTAYPDFRGNNATILTDSGGIGIMLTDLLIGSGFELGSWGLAERERLEDALPDFLSIGNPMDGAGDFAWARPPLEVAFECAETNAKTDFVIVALGGLPDSEAAVGSNLVRWAGTTGKPVFVVWLGGLGTAVDLLNEAGIPAFDDLRSLTEALEAVRDANLWRAATDVVSLDDGDLARQVSALIAPFVANGDRNLDEVTSKMLLDLAGLPVVREATTGTPDEAVTLADATGYPVVMKLRAPGLMHKTEAGAISLGVAGPDDVRREADRLLAIAREQTLPDADIVIQPQVDAGVELLLGMYRDATYGPVIAFGLGGVLTEVLDDVQVVLPTVSEHQFHRAFASLRHRKLLDGYRHLPPVGADVLWPVVSSFARLVRALPPEVLEIDVNPVVVHGDGRSLAAVDALVVLSSASDL